MFLHSQRALASKLLCLSSYIRDLESQCHWRYLKSGEFSDMTIICGNRKFAVQKFVIFAQSKVLKASIWDAFKVGGSRPADYPVHIWIWANLCQCHRVRNPKQTPLTWQMTGYISSNGWLSTSIRVLMQNSRTRLFLVSIHKPEFQCIPLPTNMTFPGSGNESLPAFKQSSPS